MFKVLFFMSTRHLVEEKLLTCVRPSLRPSHTGKSAGPFVRRDNAAIRSFVRTHAGRYSVAVFVLWYTPGDVSVIGVLG